MSNSLDLYGKLESMIPFHEELEGLYEIFAQEVLHYKKENLLDVGCGSGKFAKLVMEKNISVEGIDLSTTMVEKAKALGVNANVIDICQVTKKYQCITAVFDVLNYLDSKELDTFLGCIANALEDGGVFIADINTLHGFQDVAQGDLLLEDEKSYGSISSEFHKDQLISKLNLFQKYEDLYTREQGEITQYYHPLDLFLGREDLKLIKTTDIFLFSHESDKMLLVLEKR